MATSMTWSDGMGSRSRASWLLFIKGDEVIRFGGKDIVGVAVIRGTDFTKNGKWSHTTFRIELADGVRVIGGKDGWETGKFTEGLRTAVGGDPIDRWPDMARALGVSVPSAMSFFRAWRPKAAEALDAVDIQLEALEASSVVDTETVVVSFGGPTNRQIEAGFWGSPKGIPGYEGAEIHLLDPSKGWGKENIVVSGMTGTVIAAVHAAGYHGGYVSVTVAVVPGTLSPVAATELVAEAEPSVETQASQATEPATLADLASKFGRRP